MDGWMGGMVGARRSMLVGALVLGCTSATKDADDGAGGTAGDTVADSTTPPSGGELDDDDEDEGHVESPFDEEGGSDPDTSETGDYVECVDEDLPACSVERIGCVSHQGWNCGHCIGDVSKPLCYEASKGCEYPWLECPELPSPCGVVRALGAGVITGFEDADAAVCLLESVRDGVAGVYTIEWGEDSGADTWPLVEVLVGSNGTATMQTDFQYVCDGVCTSLGVLVRSNGMGLQPDSYFDACLDAPTTESLATCILGFTEFDAESPAPLLWTPPFTTGECVDELFECPPA